MRHVWTIARFDLLREMQNRLTFLIGLLMPSLMMFILGISIGETEGTIYLDVIDEDDSPLSRQVVALLAEEVRAEDGDDQAFVLCTYRTDSGEDCGLDDDLPQRPGDWRATADERLEDTDTYGALIIEEGFGARLRAGEPVDVIFKNNEELSAPTLATQKIEAALSRLGGSVAVTHLTLRVARESFGGLGDLGEVAAFDQVRTQIEAAWDGRPVTVRTTPTQHGEARSNGFNQSGPGTAGMFVLIFMLNSATLLVYERETGTLPRLLTLPVRRGVILAGKILGRYLYGLALFAMLVAVGALMGVEWGENWIGVGLIVLAFTLAATALGLALATLVRTSAQANSISLLMGLTLAPLGGAWWPLELVPDFMKAIGHISPVAWAMDAFQELIWYGGTVRDILPMLAVMLAMAGACFAFGVWRFRYE